jgi:hypothetical protein
MLISSLARYLTLIMEVTHSYETSTDIQRNTRRYIPEDINIQRDNSVGIATGYRPDTGVRFPAGARDFSLLYSVQMGSGARVASYWMGTGGYFPGVRAARE